MRAAPLLALLLLPGLARGEATPTPEGQAARFALVVGVNHAGEPGLPTLQYADDDAARYQDLFRLLGARTYLLTRLDENTRRLHPQAAAEARDPTRHELDEAVKQLALDVARAKAAQVPTVLYFVYAGHGNVEGGVGYLSLEDARLTGATLAQEVLQRIDADQAHLIVDACYSYFLAFGRGPGGARRPLHNFTATPELARDDRWGLLLSTSSARESHEWEAFQAGVFSHEVRSGLYGAADADGDGWVSYPEMVAFIEKANAAIPNEKYRPDVFARPPKQTDRLADLRGAQGRRIEIEGSRPAHYLLEDGRGVRLADFHNAPGESLRLLHPAGAGPLYLRRLDTNEEYAIAPAPEVIALASLEPTPPRTHARGAAHDSFDLLFSLPFSHADVHPLRPPTLELTQPLDREPSLWTDRHAWGWLTLGVGVLGGGAAGFSLIQAEQQRSLPAGASQLEVSNRNAQIVNDNRNAWILGAVGGTAAAVGLGLLLWPEDSPSVSLRGTPQGFSLTYASAF